MCVITPDTRTAVTQSNAAVSQIRVDGVGVSACSPAAALCTTSSVTTSHQPTKLWYFLDEWAKLAISLSKR